MLAFIKSLLLLYSYMLYIYPVNIESYFSLINTSPFIHSRGGCIYRLFWRMYNRERKTNAPPRWKQFHERTFPYKGRTTIIYRNKITKVCRYFFIRAGARACIHTRIAHNALIHIYDLLFNASFLCETKTPLHCSHRILIEIDMYIHSCTIDASYLQM